jgi:glucose/arabinose dehydrogenase
VTSFVRSVVARERSTRGLARLVAAALVLSTMVAARAAEPAWTRIAGMQPGGRSVAQTGSAADEIRANLRDIRLPPGFAIELYALVPDARHMAVAPGTDTLFVGTQTGIVWVVTHRAGAAPVVAAFVPSERFVNPNGVCFAGDGTLVVAQRNRVSRYRVDGSWNDPANVARTDVLAQGQLLPPDEEATGHSARTCRVGPDNKVYVTIGEPFNVQPRAKVERYRALGIGGIVRFDLDGTKREVYATGLRNSVGQDFNPKDGTLWFTDNQTDNLGDDQPPGELDHATKPGQDFGYPYWCGHVKVAGSPVARDLADLPEPAGAVFPQVEFPAHQAQLGMTFYEGTMFPAPYRGGIFVAAHGSWNRTVSTGALVDFVPLVTNAKAGASVVFAQGFRRDDGTYWGRPVDVATLRDGSLLVSDDTAGAVYRITYKAL